MPLPRYAIGRFPRTAPPALSICWSSSPRRPDWENRFAPFSSFPGLPCCRKARRSHTRPMTLREDDAGGRALVWDGSSVSQVAEGLSGVIEAIEAIDRVAGRVGLDLRHLGRQKCFDRSLRGCAAALCPESVVRTPARPRPCRRTWDEPRGTSAAFHTRSSKLPPRRHMARGSFAGPIRRRPPSRSAHRLAAISKI